MPALDAVLFEQVLFNLLDNAAKYAPAGTRRPTIAPAWHEQSGLQMPRSSCRSSTKAPAFRPRRSWNASSISSYRVKRGRPAARRHRSWPHGLPRLHRGDGREHRSQSNRQDRSAAPIFTIHLADPGVQSSLDAPAPGASARGMSLAPLVTRRRRRAGHPPPAHAHRPASRRLPFRRGRDRRSCRFLRA